MSIEQQVVDLLRTLPADKQREVLEFAESLQEGTTPTRPRRSAMGLCADLNQHITEEDIAEARREMWGNFPREDV